MFWAGKITSLQKRGVTVCSPKERGPQLPADFRPINLLNSDYKLVARLFAQRSRPNLAEHLKDTQFCGVPGNTILDAVASIRDTIAYAEIRRFPLCVLSLDFQNTFDRISHKYLFQILPAYGIDTPLIDGIRQMYKEASSSVQINGHLYGPVPIRCAVRQRCPMSMALYALVSTPSYSYCGNN
jgi:hypothetical protein